MLAAGDQAGLSRLLDVWEELSGLTEWSLFLRGYAALLALEIDAAEKAFLEAWQYRERWQTAYNLAVIYRHKLSFDNALEFLRKAEVALGADGATGITEKAMIRTQIARLLHTKGDIDGAKREAQYAVDLDPGSVEADLILKLLESRPD
jgi:tetratricopeptide (TPR) repeat protein